VDDLVQWSQLSDWCMEAEAAAAVSDVDLAARSRDVLASYADRISMAAPAPASGR